jgi:hypothetical protein
MIYVSECSGLRGCVAGRAHKACIGGSIRAISQSYSRWNRRWIDGSMSIVSINIQYSGLSCLCNDTPFDCFKKLFLYLSSIVESWNSLFILFLFIYRDYAESIQLYNVHVEAGKIFRRLRLFAECIRNRAYKENMTNVRCLRYKKCGKMLERIRRIRGKY